MSQDLLSQKISSLQEEVDAAIQRVESFQQEHRAESKAQAERTQALLDSLDARIAEQERYKAMNPVQQFFYRLFRRPAWL